MAEEQKQMNINFVDTKPIFADDVALIIRVKAAKSEKGDIEKEGQMMLVFIDMIKSQALGEFVISKNTAKSLVKLLSDNIVTLEKQLLDKSIPKKPELKTTADTSYR